MMRTVKIWTKTTNMRRVVLYSLINGGSLIRPYMFYIKGTADKGPFGAIDH